MAKRIALKDLIMADGVDLSDFARSVSFSSEHEQVDVSGFNSTGSDEFLAGKTTQSVTVEFFGSYGTGEVHQTLYPLHRDKLTFDFVWRPDGSASASATNPELRGTVQAFTYGPGATRGDVDAFSVTFNAATGSTLEFFAT
jgi:hypothetical protein